MQILICAGLVKIMNPFDYVNSINHKKNNMMRDTDNDQLAEDLYKPYVVNKALSYFTDTVFFANHVNQSPHMDNKLQYEFLLNSIRPRKRFAKWVKSEDNNDLEMVKEYYGFSDSKAIQALSILSPDQIETIRRNMIKGTTNESGNGG